MAFVVKPDATFRPSPTARGIIAAPFRADTGAAQALAGHGGTPVLQMTGNTDDAFAARVLAHYTRYLGPVAQDWRDRTPGWPMRLVAFDGTSAQNERFFATCGLGRQAARMPDGRELHCELIFAAHQDGPTDDIVRMMLGVSELVGRSKDALLRGDVIRFTAPILPGTLLTGLYCTMPAFCPSDFACLEPAGSGAPIVMIWLIPVYESEKAYIRAQGWRRFEDDLDRLDPDLLDLHRQPIGTTQGSP
ncbi:suppressor of fused domain protein [Komagataeibacter sp. AV436]|uniref:Suppressor of fused domain protein n=1 Tax=Komagataeibacter melomenusus TaxID=2766578 RepID=A0ABX2AB94_9PROT|nr:suppressor of fused domain protein [Komagataeibacter melomenusus]MBV1829708.1 suppressor of fused domain protein [Komagataeibacter melomenusus]NPC65091.1 suppressor of fused domain protein [Komagataeibacter melomenusus]